MSSPRPSLRYIFDGGWTTDLSPRALAGPDGSGLVRIPYLLTAENIVYELDGGVRKAPGATKVNSSAVGSGADITGCYDAWFHGASGTPTQHRIITHTTVVMEDDADGTFIDLFTGLVSGAVPTFAMLEDLLIIAFDSSDVLKSWDGTTAQNLAGSPPNGSIVCAHANRLWVSGVYADPSGVYYSPLLDPANTTAEGWGRIGFDPSDGDRVMAMTSYKGELIVWKGPYHGSIHRLTGTAPTGDQAYARKRWIEGVGACGPNVIFKMGDDIGFVGFDAVVHSLKAVAAYGDFNEVALSRPIQSYMNRAVFSGLKKAWAVSGTSDGIALFSFPVDGATVNNTVIGMDYRFMSQQTPPRWFRWPAFSDMGHSLMCGIDPAASNRRIYFSGGGDGFLRKLQQSHRVIDTATPIAMRVETPYFDDGDPFMMKTMGEAYVQFSPKNGGNILFGFRRDSANAQVFEINQAAGDPLGTVSGPQFTLGVSMLGASNVVEKFFEADQVGEYRQIQFTITNDIASEDVEVHAFGMRPDVGGISTRNDQ